MQAVDRFAIFERLKYSIQLLAGPAEIQLRMLPRFVCRVNELALDFDLWKEIVLNTFRSELSTDQICRMESIDLSLSELTRMGPEHWTEEAVRESDEWKRIRTLAALALVSFGWARDTPPSHAGEYVSHPKGF